MHPRVSVSAISTYSWSLDEDLAFWADAAITNVGVSVAKVEQAGWDEALERVASAGLRIGNLIGLGPFSLADRAQWSLQQERLTRVVDAAARLQAECLVLTTGPAGPLSWDEAANRLEEVLTPTLDAAAAAGVPLALEHTNSLRVDVGFVHSLRDAIDLAVRLGCGVCMEVNACWAERDLAATVAGGVDTLALVQISDFAVGTLNTPNRLVPGDGDIPLERIVGQVLDAGYAGCFDLELIGPRIDEEGPQSAIPRAVDYLTQLLERLGA
ncbi:MAG: sugar phosphate isomerase/epimerase family protein [Acidimicrobiia bacterium]